MCEVAARHSACCSAGLRRQSERGELLSRDVAISDIVPRDVAVFRTCWWQPINNVCWRHRAQRFAHARVACAARLSIYTLCRVRVVLCWLDTSREAVVGDQYGGRRPRDWQLRFVPLRSYGPFNGSLRSWRTKPAVDHVTDGDPYCSMPFFLLEVQAKVSHVEVIISQLLSTNNTVSMAQV